MITGADICKRFNAPESIELSTGKVITRDELAELERFFKAEKGYRSLVFTAENTDCEYTAEEIIDGYIAEKDYGTGDTDILKSVEEELADISDNCYQTALEDTEVGFEIEIVEQSDIYSDFFADKNKDEIEKE